MRGKINYLKSQKEMNKEYYTKEIRIKMITWTKIKNKFFSMDIKN